MHYKNKISCSRFIDTIFNANINEKFFCGIKVKLNKNLMTLDAEKILKILN